MKRYLYKNQEPEEDFSGKYVNYNSETGKIKYAKQYSVDELAELINGNDNSIETDLDKYLLTTDIIGKKSFNYIKEGLVYEWNCLKLAPSIDDGVWTACVGDNTIALNDACSLAEDGGLRVVSTEEVAMAIANETIIGDDEPYERGCGSGRIIEFVCKLDTDSTMLVESNHMYTNLIYEDGVWKNKASFRHHSTGVYYYTATSIKEASLWSVGLSVKDGEQWSIINGKTTTTLKVDYNPQFIDETKVTALGDVTIYAIRIYDGTLITSCSVEEMFKTNNIWNLYYFGDNSI